MNREIIIYAFRYALGRQSVAPFTVSEYIKENIENISSWDLKLINKEIIECEDFWGDIDKNTWVWLLNFITYYLNNK